MVTGKELLSGFFLFKNHEALFSTGSVFQILRVFVFFVLSTAFCEQIRTNFPPDLSEKIRPCFGWSRSCTFLYVILWNGVFYFKKVILGGRFKREGAYVYLRLIHVDIWQKPTQGYKAVILQLNRNKFFLKRTKGIKHVETLLD